MATVIRTRNRETQRLPEIFFRIFPPALYSALIELCDRGVQIDEVRLRTGKCVSVTSQNKNIMLNCVLDRACMDTVFAEICDSSLYAHADTINCGYVTLSGGVRVGIVGRAAVADGRVMGVYDASALCFRLPRRIPRVGAPVCKLLEELAGEGGVLVYSPPGHGKTTLLRAVAAKMASGASPWRVVVIDSRGELGFALEDSFLCIDVMTGYPRSLGLEIAARSMNAQLIVCDEIGDTEEARAIIAVQNCGVPLLATAHASSVGGLLRRTGLRALHDARVFGAYVGIRRRMEEGDYVYTVTGYEEADSYIQNSGSGNACR